MCSFSSLSEMSHLHCVKVSDAQSYQANKLDLVALRQERGPNKHSEMKMLGRYTPGGSIGTLLMVYMVLHPVVQPFLKVLHFQWKLAECKVLGMLVEAIKSPKIVARMENNAPIGSCIKLYTEETPCI
jgi:hypothetical protein